VDHEWRAEWQWITSGELSGSGSSLLFEQAGTGPFALPSLPFVLFVLRQTPVVTSSAPHDPPAVLAVQGASTASNAVLRECARIGRAHVLRSLWTENEMPGRGAESQLVRMHWHADCAPVLRCEEGQDCAPRPSTSTSSAKSTHARRNAAMRSSARLVQARACGTDALRSALLSVLYPSKCMCTVGVSRSTCSESWAPMLTQEQEQ
jgi:hypothetical protein